MKLYLAGPMRGIERHNFPAFDTTSTLLRISGHEVFNPADHDREIGFSEETIEVPEATLHQMMRWDLARVMEVDAVVFLPGWQASRGACAERVVAHYLGLPCYNLHLTEEGSLELRLQPPYREPTIIWTEDVPVPTSALCQPDVQVGSIA